MNNKVYGFSILALAVALLIVGGFTSCAPREVSVSPDEGVKAATSLVQMLHPSTQLERIYLLAAADVKQVAGNMPIPKEIWDNVSVNIDGNEITKNLVAAYRSAMTDEDIVALVAFYESPQGARIRKSSMFAAMEADRVFSTLRTQLAYQIAENVKAQLIAQEEAKRSVETAIAPQAEAAAPEEIAAPAEEPKPEPKPEEKSSKKDR